MGRYPFVSITLQQMRRAIRPRSFKQSLKGAQTSLLSLTQLHPTKI